MGRFILFNFTKKSNRGFKNVFFPLLGCLFQHIHILLSTFIQLVVSWRKMFVYPTQAGFRHQASVTNSFGVV